MMSSIRHDSLLGHFDVLHAAMMPNCLLQLSQSDAVHAECCCGVLCSKLLNSCVPDTIDERALNVPAEPPQELAPKEALQNSNLCIHAASALGCAVSAVSAQDILGGSQDAVKCCVWEFIRLGALKVSVTPSKGPCKSTVLFLARQPLYGCDIASMTHPGA